MAEYEDLRQRHLAELDSDAYLFDELHVVASGGSSGRRGIFAFGWRPWAEAYAGSMRTSFWDLAVTPELAGLGLPDPSVEVRPVDRLERQATGKVRRFRPLEAAEVGVSRPA